MILVNVNLHLLFQCQSRTSLVCHKTIFWRLHHVCYSAKQCRTCFRGSCKWGFTNQSKTRILGLRFHCHLCHWVFPKNVGSRNVFASWIIFEVKPSQGRVTIAICSKTSFYQGRVELHGYSCCELRNSLFLFQVRLLQIQHSFLKLFDFKQV